MSTYFVHETAEVDPSAIIGKNSKIWHHAQIRENVRIGENCHIGKGVYLDKDVVIGNNVKVQNGVSVYKGVSVEDDVLLGPHCSFTNDLYPRAFSQDWEITPTLLKRGCSIGANATILCGTVLGEYCMVGAGAVVVTDTLPFSLMVGNPARIKNFVCVCGYELKELLRRGMNLEMECTRCHKILQLNFVLKDQG